MVRSSRRSSVYWMRISLTSIWRSFKRLCCCCTTDLSSRTQLCSCTFTNNHKNNTFSEPITYGLFYTICYIDIIIINIVIIIIIHITSQKKTYTVFLDPEGRFQKATLFVVVLLLVVVISPLKIPKAFLIRSRAQWNFANRFMLTFSMDLPSQIFHLFSN